MTDSTWYDRWRGDTLEGRTKIDLAQDIANAINTSGVIIQRTGRSVKERIQQIESKYKEASDWRQRTGSGVTSESSLREALTKYCKYYFELQPVMEDRPHVRPPYTNQMDDEIDNQSEDDSLLGRYVHRLDEDGARMRDDEDGTRKRDDDIDDEITRIHVDRENSSVTSDVNVIRRVSPVATSAPNKKRKATPSFVQLNSAVKCIRRSTHIPSKTLLGASDGINEYYSWKAEAELETSRSKLKKFNGAIRTTMSVAKNYKHNISVYRFVSSLASPPLFRSFPFHTML